MGRYYWSKKTEADGLKKVSTSFLRKNGYLNLGWKTGTVTWSNRGEKMGNISIESYVRDDPHLVFRYSITNRETEEKTNYCYSVPLATTPCYFGGKRYWFICPWYVNGQYCGRRVGVLFMSGKHFACRHCHNLSYSSRNQTNGGKYSVLSSVFSHEARAQKLEEQIKRPIYAGKPTRKQRKLDEIYRRMRSLEGVLSNINMYNN